jgi:hypothetical protein
MDHSAFIYLMGSAQPACFDGRYGQRYASEIATRLQNRDFGVTLAINASCK